MANNKKKKNNKNRKKNQKEPSLMENIKSEFTEGLKEGTRRIVKFIFYLFIAVILIFSALQSAGIAGEYIYDGITKVVGIGYYLFPLVFILLAIFTLVSIEEKLPLIKKISIGIFLLAGLALIEFTAQGKGGLVGYGIVKPLNYLFGVYVSFSLMAAIALSTLFIIFDVIPSTKKIRTILAGIIGKFKKEPAEEEMEEVEEEAGEPAEEIEEAEEEEKQKAETAAHAKAAGGASGQKETTKEKESEDIEFQHAYTQSYSPPPLKLLSSKDGKPSVGDIKANSNLIKRTLQNFGIDVEIDEISVGPTVTRYALKPAEGVRLSKIVNLQSNLELALAAHPVRIEAPIPGRSLVGIEVPNSARATVGLSTLLGSKKFQQSDSPLTITLGKSISGDMHFTDIAKMPHMLIAGATGAGKTCGKDTYIFSEKGMMTFEELCPLPLNSETDYSLKLATRDGIEQTSKNYNNGICDFYKIITVEGFSVEVTAEHPLWVIQDGSTQWKSSGSIQIGDYVAILRGVYMFGADKEIDFTPAPNKTNKAREIKIPTKMTPQFGLFMGMLTADGELTISNKHRIVYTGGYESLLNLYRGLLNELFGIEAPIVRKSGSSNKTKDVIVHSRHLKDLLASLGMGSEGAQKKEVPLSIRKSSAETIKSFIQGVISNDGHISSKQGLEITVANKKLLHQLQLTLLNFGIISHLKPKKIKGYENNNYWRLSIYGGEFAKYAEEIGFLTKEERQRAEKVCARLRNANRDVVPTLSPILKSISQRYQRSLAWVTNRGLQYRKDTAVPKYTFNNLRSYNSGDRNPSYEALGQILDSDSPEYRQLANIQEQNFYWAKVEKIEGTSGVGYDFEVPGSNSFVGNGFVNHNSVTIHSIVTSLLYRNSPANLRFIMVDPKHVELTLYKNIPHLLTPVITEPKKAILALKWAAKEMEKRYNILETEAVRDISSYHQKVVNPAYEKANKNGENAEGSMPDPMPYIVIVIDEIADIMHSYPRELESAIVRLAQLSRAVGIHLILSTQRPSVNVVTGLIKANIPARIALQVSSQIDSRTILDCGGAEQLLGAGDMLYVSGEMGRPKRVQSPFISENEVKKVTKYLTSEYENEITDEINLTENENGQDKNSIFDATAEEEDEDELYQETRQMVIQSGKASTSYLQRRLRIGYARAARLVDLLEERGVIGPADGSKPREVFEKPEQELEQDESQKSTSEEENEDKQEEGIFQGVEDGTREERQDYEEENGKDTHH